MLNVQGSYFDTEDAIDGFTKYGVRILHPTATQWVEVSALGHIYESKRHYGDMPTTPAYADLGNQLVDGTLIDVGGIILIFQDPITLVKALKVTKLRLFSLSPDFNISLGGYDEVYEAVDGCETSMSCLV